MRGYMLEHHRDCSFSFHGYGHCGDGIPWCLISLEYLEPKNSEDMVNHKGLQCQLHDWVSMSVNVGNVHVL